MFSEGGEAMADHNDIFQDVNAELRVTLKEPWKVCQAFLVMLFEFVRPTVLLLADMAHYSN